MEVGNKRHGKKSDKETQSPVLKVFKEMIQRENKDPEKANLLKEKHENRKRRQYSGSRSKSDRNQRSCDSSSSEKHRRNVQYKIGVGLQDQRIKDYNQTRSHSLPFQGDKKDSWWFWGDTEKKKSEDSCSCVSCALKRIVNSEYTCIACLGVLFLVSVLVAFMLLFRTVPVVIKEKSMSKKPRDMNSEVLKKKIEMLQRGYGDETAFGDGGKDRRLWDDTMTRHLSSLTGFRGNDFDDGSYREANALDESAVRSDSELSGVLDADKLNDGLSSDRLRNFYRKLIQTDAQIRNLKKGVSDYTSLNNMNQNSYNIPERSKRSLKLRGPKSLLRFNTKKEAKDVPIENIAELHKFNLFYPPFYAVNSTKKNSKKPKRHVNGTDEPTGFLIEKKQILVQYKPRGALRKVPKCSHAPKESKSHEKQLKHPFYKNTQRLDELLDQFLDKNLPEMMIDPFGVDVLFKKKDKTKTHKTNVKIETEKPLKKPVAKEKGHGKDSLFNKKQYKAKLNKEFFDLVTSKHRINGKITSSTTPAYDVLLSVSTIVNPGLRKIAKSATTPLGRTPSLLERVPNIRRLMQLEEEDEDGLGYEDLKEVLADDTEAHDDTDRVPERKKRMHNYEIMEDPKLPYNPLKYNPPGVHNPNWKGPMPLYPDELSSMIKQAAIQNLNKVQVPVNTKDVSSEVDRAEKDLSDVEYIENYSDNKFDKLVRMAQAYSDYGVLEGKKELVRNDNKPVEGKGVERIVKLSVNKGKSLRDALLTRFKKRKCTVSEGIRFEFRPTTSSREDTPIEIMKALQKHVKVTNPSIKSILPHFQATQLPINTEYSLFSATVEKNALPNRGCVTSKKNDAQNDYSDGSGVVFTLAKGGKRNLKSVRDDVNYNSDGDINVSDITGVATKKPARDEYGDNSVVFAFAKTTKSIVDGVQSHFDDSINEDMNVVKIGKRSLKSIDDENATDNDYDIKKSNLALVRQDSSHLGDFENKNDFKLDIGVENKHFNSNKSSKEGNVIKRDVSGNHSEIYETSSIRITKESGKHIRETLSNDTKKFNKSSSLFEDNMFINLIAPRSNDNSSEMDLGEFFRMMANWFSLLAESDNSYNESTTAQNEAQSNINKFTTKKTLLPSSKTNESLNVVYPMYDSDMIENIGHRSRVLMGVEEHDNISTDVPKIHKSSVQANSEEVSSTVIELMKSLTMTSKTPSTTDQESPNTNILTSNESTTSLATKYDVDGNTKVEENKTIVKRNVPEDSNLIFWNDMYDDEYGIKLDPIDSAIRDKHNVRGMDFMKRSGNWIQDKVRSFASSFRKDKEDGKRRLLRGAKYHGYNPYSESTRNRFVKRDTKYEDDESDENLNSFSALTAKMKSVCKEAAKEVQQTKNLKVRQNEKEDTMTTSLMQQLVRLMTDLIDFQVKQKTCVKLPPDLQEFLEWLTAPSPEQMELRNPKMSYHDDSLVEKPTDQVLDLITTPSSEKEEVHSDSRSDCLGTLHAVQDLLQQFDEMAEDDKSKMTGIREYLENQLQFLNKQLTAYDDYKIPSMFEEQNPMRFRRDIARTFEDQRRYKNQINSRRRRRRFKRRFLKNFSKKHTRTTASIYDGYPITENNKLEIEDNNEEKVNGGKKVKIEKRNLRDVYYKAVEDAKKSTTFKNVHKDEMEGFDNAQIVRIEN